MPGRCVCMLVILMHHTRELTHYRFNGRTDDDERNDVSPDAPNRHTLSIPAFTAAPVAAAVRWRQR